MKVLEALVEEVVKLRRTVSEQQEWIDHLIERSEYLREKLEEIFEKQRNN